MRMELFNCHSFSCNSSNSRYITKKLYCKKKSAPERERILYEYVSETDYLLCSIAACAAANLAIGTRNGEQET